MNEPQNSKKAPGLPWLKGQSGNPGGTRFIPDIRDMLLSITNGKGFPLPTPTEQMKAMSMLLAYCLGMPGDVVELSGERGGPLRVEVNELDLMSTGELRGRLTGLMPTILPLRVKMVGDLNSAAQKGAM